MPGAEVYAGTINGNGTLTVEATKAAGDTVLSRIIRMVEDAHVRRASSEQWVERFARIYTPTVMGLALLVFLAPPLMFGGAWDAWVLSCAGPLGDCVSLCAGDLDARFHRCGASVIGARRSA